MDFLIKKISSKIISQVICILLLGLIVWQVVTDFALFETLDMPVAIPESLANLKPEKIPETSLDSIAIFGDYIPETLDAAGVKKSDLNVTIVGIMYAEDENDSQVLIRMSDGYDHIYRAGDIISGGGTIKRITEDGVLVYRNGTMERLSLPKDDLDFSPAPETLNEESY